MSEREQKYDVSRKVGMINLWRKRCTALKQTRPVNPADCAMCDAVAAEIAADVQECTMRRAFNKIADKAIDN